MNNINKTFIFVLVFFSVYVFFLFVEYYNLPHLSFDEKPIFLIGNERQYLFDRTRDLEFNLGDGYITYLENAIIWISCLWGFMKLFKLFTQFDDRDEKTLIADFFKNVESNRLCT